MPPSRRAYASNGSSPNVNHHLQLKHKFHPSSSDDTRTSSFIPSISARDYERLSSEQALKRTLPPFIRGNDNEFFRSESGGSRVLPPSFMHSKPIFNSQYASSSDPAYHPGIGEERVADSDERLIYQAALEVFPHPVLLSLFQMPCSVNNRIWIFVLFSLSPLGKWLIL